MIKLLFCLGCTVLIAVTMLQLRQQQLELRHQAAGLEQQIELQQAKLWSQQLQISIPTSPPAIARTVGHDLPLVPEMKLPGPAGDWIRVGMEQGER